MLTRVVIIILVSLLFARLLPLAIRRHRVMKAHYYKWRSLFDQNLHTNVNEVRWRFKWAWPPGYFEIWITPIVGRYPNLQDQEPNLDYDISRIERELSTEPFFSGTPYTHGSWVCIPFHKQQEAS